MKYDERYKGAWALKMKFENGSFAYMINLKSGLNDAQLNRLVEDMQPLVVKKIVSYEYLPYDDIFKN